MALRRSGPPARRAPLPRGRGTPRRSDQTRPPAAAPKRRPLPAAVRQAAIARAAGRCQARLVCDGAPADSVHHRLPQGRGGPHEGWNLLAVCGDGTRGCHGHIEHHPELARSTVLADGLPLSVPGSYDRRREVYTGPLGVEIAAARAACTVEADVSP